MAQIMVLNEVDSVNALPEVIELVREGHSRSRTLTRRLLYAVPLSRTEPVVLPGEAGCPMSRCSFPLDLPWSARGGQGIAPEGVPCTGGATYHPTPETITVRFAYA